MPPPGPRTPLNVTYGWGTPGAISGAQDITQFKDTFQPDAGIFSPSYPLVPVDNERARLWDYPTGYNYIYKPRSYEPISFEELRARLALLAADDYGTEILRNRDGSIRGYDVLAGDTIKLLVDITGRTPTAPAPAYQQVIHGRPWRLFSTEELLYKPRNVRPNKMYGYSPVEQILMTINIGLRRQLMQLEHFTEGNVPVGIIPTALMRLFGPSAT